MVAAKTNARRATEPSHSISEINFIRLLGKTEMMALDVKLHGHENWRLPKYVEALEEMLKDIRTGPSAPDRETLSEYRRRLDLLNGVIATTKLATVEEKMSAASQLAQLNVSECSVLDSSRPAEIKHRHRNKCAEDLRKELFKTTKDEDTVDGTIKTSEDKELDEILRFQHRVQEQIVDHMLDMTKALKDQARLAGDIVRKDTDVLTKSVTQVDTNKDKLKIETEKLETYNRRACKCWVWFMLAVIFATFIGMVLFMRLFRKRIVYPTMPTTTTPAPGHDEI